MVVVGRDTFCSHAFVATVGDTGLPGAHQVNIIEIHEPPIKQRVLSFNDALN